LDACLDYLLGLGLGIKFLFSILHFFDMVTELGMRSAKDKPLTKKEREEKRRKRKEKRLKK
jgi:hypothetical protein